MSKQQRTLADWQAMAQQLSIRNLAFINGRYVAAQSGARFDCINPATGQVLTQVAACDSADAELAVASARLAFDDGRWSRQAPAARKRVLLKFAELIRQHADELALLETLDMGKPIGDSTVVDVPAAARCIQWYAEAIDKVYDEVAPTGEGALALITREPVGVVAAIVPWNFPLLMASWKLGPALATGNSVILKPSEKSPLTALRIAELASMAGLPDGVLNVLPGFGHTVGQALAEHMQVDSIAFTGSTRTGKRIMQAAASSNLKRVSLELGGKSPNIVLPDCPDLDAAAKAAAFNIFFNQGEMCSAASRLLVEASIKDAFLDKVLAVAQQMQPGDPLDPATSMGAVVDDVQFNTILSYIAAGKAEGARLLAGGAAARSDSGGYFIAPTVFDEVGNQMKIAQEEIFGPVLSVLSFNDVEQAIQIANDTCYGLGAGLWTRDLSKAHTLARRLRAGTVWVNNYEDSDITVPFGGYKQSGMGRDKSLHALDKYTELKTTWIKL